MGLRVFWTKIGFCGGLIYRTGGTVAAAAEADLSEFSMRLTSYIFMIIELKTSWIGTKLKIE